MRLPASCARAAGPQARVRMVEVDEIERRGDAKTNLAQGRRGADVPLRLRRCGNHGHRGGGAALYLLAMAMALTAFVVLIHHRPRATRATAVWGALGGFVVGAVAMYFLAGLAAR